jgi:Rad52/22 family double-strand break repair protein
MTTTLSPARSITSRNAPTALQHIRQAFTAESDHESATPATPHTAPGLTSALPRQANPTAPAGFTTTQLAALSAPLDRSLVSSREQGRSKLNYLQSWVVINEANRIFGFDGWQRQTLFCHCVTQGERMIGPKDSPKPQKPGWGVTYIARVRISVRAGNYGLLIREGTGAGHGIDTDLGLAHESAIKEAETDAMKRALMTFGNPFGLALYDKSLSQVKGPEAPTATQGDRGQRQNPANGVVRRLGTAGGNPVAAAFNGPAWDTTAPAPSQAPTALTPKTPAAPAAQSPTAAAPDSPLDPPTIRSLQERIRNLLPPQVAAFSSAFRSAFQIPDSTPSIAGLITEQRHRAWIQQYLAQGLAQPQARTA